MRRYPLCFAMLLTGCSDGLRVETQIVVPDVPQDLRAPCLVAPREYESLADVALILTDHVEAVDCANGKIVAIDGILTDAEAQAASTGGTK